MLYTDAGIMFFLEPTTTTVAPSTQPNNVANSNDNSNNNGDSDGNNAGVDDDNGNGRNVNGHTNEDV